MTDLLVDLLDRYEPEPPEEDTSDLVNEDAAGVDAVGLWTLLGGGSLSEADEVLEIVERLGLREDDEFEISEGLLSLPADGLDREDLIALLEKVDSASDLLEVSGELDVRERSVTWLGEGDALEPMPMPIPRPGDVIPLLVEEVAIHLARHEASAPARAGRYVTHPAGIEVYGRPYLLVRDEIEDPDALLQAFDAAGVPRPGDLRAHRLEWEGEGLRPAAILAAVHALRSTNPAIALSTGVTWRNEPLEVEEEEEPA